MMTDTAVKRLLCALLPLLFAAFPLHAQTPITPLLAEVETTWKGVKLQITQCIRIDATHILVGISVVAGPKATNLVYIGDPPEGGEPPPDAPDSVRLLSKYSPTPFALTAATLIDETTKKEF